MSTRWFLCLIALLCACQTVPPFIPAALPEPPTLEIEPAIATDIPAGLYLGVKHSRAIQYVEGQIVSDQSTDQTYSKAVNASGLPLLQPSGTVPQVGVVLRWEQTDIMGWSQITGMQGSNTQLVIFYRFAIRSANGFQLEGAGTDTYRFEAPNVLHYSGHEDASGFLIGDGKATRITLDSAATLRSD